ncbi:unnamed protein product [Caenorhabditis nigoni]
MTELQPTPPSAPNSGSKRMSLGRRMTGLIAQLDPFDYSVWGYTEQDLFKSTSSFKALEKTPLKIWDKLWTVPPSMPTEDVFRP